MLWMAVSLKLGIQKRKDTYSEYPETLQSGDETQISLTDPDSRLMKTKDGLDVCLNIQTAVDSKNKMAVEFTVENQVQDKNLMSPLAKKNCRDIRNRRSDYSRR